ncbi:MAG: type II toxin-antitoxin system RelE/ParE family toxin, partial [Prevotella sp.]|nr:type II toxin-antitoxin system RelE/ParE family toxin [Prevotella sp.]
QWLARRSQWKKSNVSSTKRSMNLKIRWTPVALQSLSEVLEYTFEEFGERQLRKLISQIYAVVRRIEAFPLSGKQEFDLLEATGIEYRSVVVISEIKLLYTVVEDMLFVEFIKNTRLDDATMLAKLNE